MRGLLWFFPALAAFAAESSWERTSAPVGSYWHSAASSADGTILYAAEELTAVFTVGQIYISTNSGVSWVTTGTPKDRWEYVACSADGKKVVATVDYGPIYTSADYGAHWKWVGIDTGWGAVVSSSDGVNLAVAPANDHVYLSIDSGATWKATASPVTNWFHLAGSADLRVLAGTAGLADANGSGVIISTNRGATWFSAGLPSSVGKWAWSAIAMSADGKRMAVGGDGNIGPIYFSTDTGRTWKAGSVALVPGGWSSMASSADGQRLVVTGGDSGGSPIYSSVDGGQNRTPEDAPLITWYAVACSADGLKRVGVSYYSTGIYTSVFSGASLPVSLGAGFSDGKVVLT